MKKLMIAVFLILGVETIGFAQQTESSCTGYDSQSQSWVYGNCNGGFFTGYDQKTGTFLTGNCREQGYFSAYNPKTQTFVTGNCN